MTRPTARPTRPGRAALLAAGVSLAALAAGPAFAQEAAAQEAQDAVSRQIGPDPELPAPTMSLLPDLKVAEIVGWRDGEMPIVPEGLTVTAYARDLAHPRTVHTLPNGDVLVVQGREPGGKPLSRPKDFIRGFIMAMASGASETAKASNLVTLLRDGDRDGTVDERHDLLTGLASPFGIAWHEGTLYVAAADAVLAYPYELGQNSISAEPRVLTPLPGGPINHHWTKDLALSPDGRFLYASVGSNSNVAESGLEAEKGRAAIWQIDRETGSSRIYASGLRNPNGLTFHPETGALWTVVNERDELGPNLVPDYMTSVREGGFYGWPWSYFGDHVDERVHPPRPDMVEKAIKPDYALSSHVAALGLTFANGSALPERFRNGAFVGEHGSWNRRAFNGYKVVFVPFANGAPSGPAEDVVTGFLDGDRARGRPVGVGIDGTGALLIADDAGDVVWRVAATGGAVTPAPIATDATAPDSAIAPATAPPNAAAPTDTVPGGAPPADALPADALPADSLPADTEPADTLPDGTEPAVTLPPADPTARETAPAPSAGEVPPPVEAAPDVDPPAETPGDAPITPSPEPPPPAVEPATPPGTTAPGTTAPSP